MTDQHIINRSPSPEYQFAAKMYLDRRLIGNSLLFVIVVSSCFLIPPQFVL